MVDAIFSRNSWPGSLVNLSALPQMQEPYILVNTVKMRQYCLQKKLIALYFNDYNYLLNQSSIILLFIIID